MCVSLSGSNSQSDRGFESCLPTSLQPSSFRLTFAKQQHGVMMEARAASAASSSSPSSASAGPSTVDSSMSRSSSTEDPATTNAREWKRLFGQMQSSHHHNVASSSSSRMGTSRSGAAAADSSVRGRGRGRPTAATTARGGRAQAGRRLLDSSSSSNTSLLPAPPSDPISRIRHKIVTTPLPPDTFLTPTGTTYRSVVWKLLLDIRSLDLPLYLSLVSKGKSPSHEKIRNDTFRTLATDQGFKERVKEEKLIRLLDAFVWKHNKSDDSADEGEGEGVYEFSYVQGMNVLAAPFLYTLESEVEAFICFSRFIEYCCPLYVQPTLSGVHRGLQVSTHPPLSFPLNSSLTS